MSIALAQPRHIFGLRSDVTGNLAYFDEQTIVYPSGTNCILYNMDQKVQKFIQGSEKSKGMTAMAISPNRRYVAVAERGDKEKGEKPVVVIYDLHTLRKRKTLSSADVQSDEFTSLAFSPDSKYLVMQGGKPDWTLLYWTWEKTKVMAKMSSQQSSAVINQVIFNPLDNTQFCVVGFGFFREFRYSEGNLRPVHALQKLESVNYLSQAWISDERVIVGAENGKLLLFELGELKHEFNMASPTYRLSVPEIDRSGQRMSSGVLESDASPASESYAVTALVAYSKGFACASGRGTVHLFEKSDDKEFYKKTRELKIPQDLLNSDTSKPLPQISCLAISPSEETLICATVNNQLYSLTLSSADINKAERGQFEILSQVFHSDQVTGLDVCIRKPLVATCSTDKSVRIWNFETCNLDLYKEFAEEAYSIALHPSGLYILVGFSDKLRLMNLLIDDIRVFKEFTIRACKECCFSNGGQYFAAVNTNVISIYSTTTFENVSNLKGHNGKVRSIVWSQDDTRLVSCGADGAVYEWEVLTAKRIAENVLKLCNYTSVVITADGKTSFAVGSDKKLKEISDSQILRSVDSPDVVLTSVALSHGGRMLFAGTMSGTLRSVKFPLTVPGEWVEYQAHGAPITKIKITYDDQYLVTIAEDACVMIWKIQEKDGRSIKQRDKDISYAEEILITKSDLEEKNMMMAELKTRVDELKMENDYQLRLKDMNYNDKIKELTEKFIQEMESLKTKNQVLKNEKDKEENKHDEQISEVQEKHAREIQDIESTNNQKLMLEYEKYQELQGKSQRMQEDYERQLSEMEEKREQALQALTEYYEAKIQELTSKLEQREDQAKQQHAENEEMKQQIEVDADREILEMRIRFEQRLKDEQEINAKLRSDTGIMRKKFTSLQKEIEDYKEEIKKNQGEISKLNGVIRNLEKDISGLKKEIQERDETIQDKERRIYDLKTKNQELDKFKFVLDYRINEQKRKVEPQENEIKTLKEQKHEMESELERFHKQNTQLELNIEELRQKLKATEKEMHQERQRVRDVEAVVMRIKTDLHNCVGYIQEPKLLKDSVKAMFQKHVQEDVTEAAGLSADTQKDFSRQREHLERTVASYKKKEAKDKEIHKAENIRIMQQNVTLISETNNIRYELKNARTHSHDLEAALGLHSQKNKPHAAEMLTKIASANKNALMEMELEEKTKVIKLMQNEILKLRNKLQDAENTHPRPPSGQRLSPLSSVAF